MKKTLFAFLVCVLCWPALKAQYLFDYTDSVPVVVSGNTLKNAWAGGLNFAMFSAIDLNGDGIKDLFVFDKTGNRVLTFLNGGTADSVDYKYAPQYAGRFPAMHDFALLVDYNCDGKEDIFTYSSGGMAVYRNDYTTATGLQFTLITNLLLSKYFNNPLNLYVSPVNLPAFADIDNDGDLDILTFDIFGTYVEYHQNKSMDDFGHCDTLAYVMTQSCWGNFAASSSSNTVVLGISCRVDPANYPPPGNINLHSGASLLALDLDNDGDKELVIGDLASTNLLVLSNGGTAASANMTAQDGTFPANYQSTVEAELSLFPASFYLDVNNDGKKDLILAPHAPNVSENFTGIWYYKNTGTNTAPVFNFVKNNFLQDEMIETGEGNNPVFFDQNGDGLLDLLIGNYGYYNTTGIYPSNLSLYRNTGTSTSPAFELITRDFANLSSLGLNGLYPAFGDLDGDGDKDMLIGDANGELHYFTNTAGAGNPASFVLTQIAYKGIDIGQYSAPQIIDIDRDGKLDLLVGKRNGRLAYFRNTGTTAVADFSSTPTVDNFGGVDVKETNFITGYASPFLYDSSGTWQLFVGSERGYVYLYDNINGNLSGNFNLVDSITDGIYPGLRLSLGGADINADGKIDLVVGNYCGGVTLYLQSDESSVNNISSSLQNSVRIYPNPARDKARIQMSNPLSVISSVSIYDITGRLLTACHNIHKPFTEIDISGLNSGIYFCGIISGDEIYFEKLVISR